MDDFDEMVVAGHDGSAAAEASTAWAAMAAQALGRPLMVLHKLAGEEADALAQGFPQATLRRVERLLRTELKQATASALMVVLPARGAGARMAQVLDATADEVLSEAQGPVVIVPRNCWNQFPAPVVLGLDVERPGLDSLRFAGMIAQSTGSTLQVLAAHDGMEQQADQTLTTARELVGEHVPDLAEESVDVRVKMWRPSDALLSLGEGSSLLVVGSRDHGFRGAAVDSESRRVLRSATCPVAVVAGSWNQHRSS
ncbi:MAG: universal stress protein [Luteococcus japonicus]